MNTSPRRESASRQQLEATGPLEPAALSHFTQREQDSLSALRSRYQEGSDLFSARELAHLHFLRWLRQQGIIQEA